MIFNICKCSINDFHPLFDDLIQVLAASLTDLGYECMLSVNNTQSNTINILIGSTMFDERLASRLLENPCIIYQMEILDDTCGHLKSFPYYLDLLRRAIAIWEYSPSNKVYLESKGFTNVFYCPPGYHPVANKIRWTTQRDYDFIFFGAMSERRLRFLKMLSVRGFKVAAISEKNKLFGIERDKVISRAKVVLNLHFFDNIYTLETVRISYLLSNKAVVISEKSDHDPYNSAVIFASYSDLLNRCIDAIHSPSSLDELAQSGFRAIARLDMRKILENTIFPLGIDRK
jgi:hypothetical protein